MKKRSQRSKHVMLFSLLTALGMVSCAEEGKRQLGILHELATDTPVYQGFQKVRPLPFENYKTRDAILVFGYRSNVDYSNVKRFYSEILQARGWSAPIEVPLGGLHGQDAVELTFRKGEYEILVGYEGPEPDSSTTNYALTFRWEGH